MCFGIPREQTRSYAKVYFVVPQRNFSLKISCKRTGLSHGCSGKAEPFKTQQLHEINTYSSLNAYAMS